MLNINHFKLINDAYDHSNGNLVLTGITRIDKKNYRFRDIIARCSDG